MMFSRKIIAVITIVFVLIGAAGIIFFISKARRSNISSGSSAAVLLTLGDSAFKSIDGREVTVSSFAGRPVIFHLWASWCSLCIKEITQLVAVKKEFGDALIIVEVNRRESVDMVKKYADQLDPGHNLMFVLDANDVLYQQIKGFSMPESVFVDNDGMVRYHVRGLMNVIDASRRIQDVFGI